MEFSREGHIQFLELELKQQVHKYLTKINNQAIHLMQKNEVYPTQFVHFKDGEMILRFTSERGIPRKGDYFTAILLKDEKRSYKNWGNISWSDLRQKYQIEFTEVVAIWSQVENSRYSLVGFRGISIEFAKKLEKNCIVVLGPKTPPYEYIKNLINIVDKMDQNDILDFNIRDIKWDPIELKNENANETILSEIKSSNKVIIQGPPGTGKTYLMSKLISSLLSQNKSVLVTALTNRALMELASKEPLKPFIKRGVVYKSNLKVDEQKEVTGLKDATDTITAPGSLMLATFYISSGWAAENYENALYDYVIMDEASQALLAMFAATTIIGKKNIWIGDPFQLPPIVEINNKTIERRNFKLLINGMETVYKNLTNPFYILTNSYRLTDRAVEYTGIFYNNNLRSCSSKDYNITLNNSKLDVQKFLHSEGGPTLIKASFAVGEYSPKNGIMFIVNLVKELQVLFGTKIKIAILTKFRQSARDIQKNIINNDKHVLVDTIERVQGLTCDITIFFIPNKLIGMSLDRALFNVATSRSKGFTLIVSDESVLSATGLDPDVEKYLTEINNNFSFPKSGEFN